MRMMCPPAAATSRARLACARVSDTACAWRKFDQRFPVSGVWDDVPSADLRTQSPRQPCCRVHLPKRGAREARENIAYEQDRVWPSMQPLPLPIGRAQGPHPPRHW